MGLKGKLIGEVEVSTHGNHAHEFFAKKLHHIAEIAPTHVHARVVKFKRANSASLVPSSTGTIHSAKDGKPGVAKHVIENQDEKNKTVTLRVVDGDLLKDYSTFVAHLHVTDTTVKWVLEYEKINEDVPHPTNVLDWVLNVNKNIDDHHKA